MVSLHAIRSPGQVLDSAGDARTGSFDALGHVFAVECPDASLALLLEEAFASLAVTEQPCGWYRVCRHHEHYELRWFDEVVVANTDRAGVLAWLQWDVNRRAVAAADADLVLHAGCVSRDGQAVLVSGVSGCGKSTLVAALSILGFDYLTDEAVPVDLATGCVSPYPRPMALDDHSLDLLPEIAAIRTHPGERSHKRLVAMQAVRTDTPPEVVMVLFPQRDPSGLTLLEPVSRGDAVVRLAENAFNFPRHGRTAIDALAQLVRDADPYVVVGDDPRAAASVVADAHVDKNLRLAPYEGDVS